MIWIPVGFLAMLILLLLMAPLFEVKLTKRTTNPLLVAALLMTIALMFGIAHASFDERGKANALIIIFGVLVSPGFFFAVVAAARFALEDGSSPPAAKTATKK